MTEAYNWVHADRDELPKLMKISTLKACKALCVVTSADDRVLLRRREYAGKLALLVEQIMLDDPNNIERDISEDARLSHVLGVSTGELSGLTTVEFLGTYRLVPPHKNKHLSLPFAVDMELPSADLPISADIDHSWVDLDEVEDFLTGNNASLYDDNLDVIGSHYALGLYLETNTYVEEC